MVKMTSMMLVLLVLASCGGGGDSADKHLTAGLEAVQKQQYDQAIASFHKATELDPKAAGAWNMLGMAYRMKNQQLNNPELKAKEIAAFQKSVEADPKFWVGMINLGATYYYQGDKGKAAPLFKKALELNPNHPEKAQLEKMIQEGGK